MAFQGKVKLYKADKGFGFITAKDGSDVFLLDKFCVDGNIPQKGDVVRYDVEPSTKDPKKLQAVNVTGGTGKAEEPAQEPAGQPAPAPVDSAPVRVDQAAVAAATRLRREIQDSLQTQTSGGEPRPPQASASRADDDEAHSEAESEQVGEDAKACAGGYGSIRSAYLELGSNGYYEAHGEDYTNPHEPVLRQALVSALEAWEPRLELPLRRVHDLACGSGEASVAFASWRRCEGCALDASDPFTYAAFGSRMGRPCRRWSFEDIAAGVMEEEQPYDLVMASFSLHLLDKSYERTTLAALARSSRFLVIATPHKKPEIDSATGWRLVSELVQERVRLRLYVSDGARRLESDEPAPEGEFFAVCGPPQERDDSDDEDVDERDVEELVARMSMEKLREAVIERGLSTAGTKGEVAARLVVAMREEQGAEDEVEEEEEEEDLEELVAVMNLAELRAACSARGLSAEGKRQQLAERLLASMSEEQEESLEELVEAMSAAQLRSALAARGLETAGRRSELAARLLEVMQEEVGEEQDDDEEEDAGNAEDSVEAKGLSKKDKKRQKEQKKREKEQRAQAAARALEEKKLRENEKRKERRKGAKQQEPQEEGQEKLQPAESSKKKAEKAKAAKPPAAFEPPSRPQGAPDDSEINGPLNEEVAAVQKASDVSGTVVRRPATSAAQSSTPASQPRHCYVWADPLPVDCAEPLAELGVQPGARVSDVELSGIMAEGGPQAAMDCGLILTLEEAVRRKRERRGQLRQAETPGLAAAPVYEWAHPLPEDSAKALAEIGVQPGARVSDVELQGILAEGGPDAVLACGLIRAARPPQGAGSSSHSATLPRRYRWADPLPEDSAAALAQAGVTAGATVDEVELRGMLADGGPAAAVACGLIQPVVA